MSFTKGKVVANTSWKNHACTNIKVWQIRESFRELVDKKEKSSTMGSSN